MAFSYGDGKQQDQQILLYHDSIVLFVSSTNSLYSPFPKQDCAPGQNALYLALAVVLYSTAAVNVLMDSVG